MCAGISSLIDVTSWAEQLNRAPHLAPHINNLELTNSPPLFLRLSITSPHPESHPINNMANLFEGIFHTFEVRHLTDRVQFIL